MSGQFVIVPARALTDPALKNHPAAFMALCFISTFARTSDGWCKLLMGTIAKGLNVSDRMARAHVAKLEQLGYLQRTAQFRNGQQVSNHFRLIYDSPLNKGAEVPLPGGAEVKVPGGAEAELPTERYISNDKDIYSPLARSDFLREIDGALKAEGFAEFDHLTESEIFLQAGACWDFLQTELKEPKAGTAAAHLRRWIRRGMKAGAIRKPAKAKSASEGRKAAEPENALQPWHEAIAPLVPPADFRAWLRPLRHEGNRLIAQSQFYAAYVQTNYGHLVAEVLPGVKIVHEKTQPKEKEPAHG